jgi:hypothetical protein
MKMAHMTLDIHKSSTQSIVVQSQEGNLFDQL